MKEKVLILMVVLIMGSSCSSTNRHVPLADTTPQSQPLSKEEIPRITNARQIDITREALYKSGEWEYKFEIRGGVQDAMPRGSFGTLKYSTDDLCQAALSRRHMKGFQSFYVNTPWGKLYWVDYVRTMYAPHGFVPEQLVHKEALSQYTEIQVGELNE